ncbi:ATP-binding protein [Chryseobacterium arthrosphaerae]|uniref:ATP-binding protein n=1 Tax=Chryseobacterium TaxID=59732 RepID=UPI0008106B9E|nr:MULTISPECIES: DUF87 domain-containing protein [Chryseobacterium]OCK51056.1 hypothetical protein BA768_18300 [Chryseobacterium sp. CBo1]UEQ78050.1 ATP-binding protein [Chryseobacterium arthrosphaerae]VXC33400.1 conserved hypothetical protein [Chryseobacterium sp. 8AT]
MLTLQTNLRIADSIAPKMEELRYKLESILNLDKYEFDNKPFSVKGNAKYMRISLLAGLSLSNTRNNDFQNLQMTSNSIHPTLFTVHNLSNYLNTLLHYRYNNLNVNWDDHITRSKIICFEILKGANYLLENDNLLEWLQFSGSKTANANAIPHLNLNIGEYADNIPAFLDMNSTAITNTQILIAGTTGSGKSNLLAVLMNEIRSLSVETSYPVNFLFFDYKGEFSDVANNAWLNHFAADRSSILDPIVAPLPFTPFKNFVNANQNEINIYSTEMANALCAIDRASISANMSNRLSEAIIDAYIETKGLPITFQMIYDTYTAAQPKNDKDKIDSVKSVLNQLIRSNLFLNEDKIDLVNNSFIIKMDKYASDGPVGKAIVYFIISKLNSIYENLTQQANDGEKVQLRHFTIIDEAHYMLDFDNKPLRNLIAVGRNKGMSVVLATQNMEHFKSKHFDFYANAQYPLIMKQQSINDGVLKDLYGANSTELQDLKQAIASLGKGELIIKNNEAILMGIGKKFKRIKVRHLI